MLGAVFLFSLGWPQISYLLESVEFQVDLECTAFQLQPPKGEICTQVAETFTGSLNFLCSSFFAMYFSEHLDI